MKVKTEIDLETIKLFGKFLHKSDFVEIGKELNYSYEYVRLVSKGEKGKYNEEIEIALRRALRIVTTNLSNELAKIK